MIKLLLPLAWLYAWVARWRVALYQRGIFRQHRLPGVVVSVGNIEVGGTGKSPVVIALCEALKAQGARPAVLTRGYRSGLAADESAVLIASTMPMPPQKASRLHADEATMQAQQLEDVPIIIGRRRYEAALRFLTQFAAPTHWILDDGFQHLRLARDCDIVLLNAAAPFDTGFCLPLGRLRELPKALARADVLILTRAAPDLPPPAVRTYLDTLGLPTHRLRFIDGKPRQLIGPIKAPEKVASWTLALGIARPERVLKSLKTQGLNLAHHYSAGDHEEFDFDRIKTLLASSDALITSEKDYWRAPGRFAELASPVYVLPLELEWERPSSLIEIIELFTESLHK